MRIVRCPQQAYQQRMNYERYERAAREDEERELRIYQRKLEMEYEMNRKLLEQIRQQEKERLDENNRANLEDSIQSVLDIVKSLERIFLRDK